MKILQTHGRVFIKTERTIEEPEGNFKQLSTAGTGEVCGASEGQGQQP